MKKSIQHFTQNVGSTNSSSLRLAKLHISFFHHQTPTTSCPSPTTHLVRSRPPARQHKRRRRRGGHPRPEPSSPPMARRNVIVQPMMLLAMNDGRGRDKCFVTP